MNALETVWLVLNGSLAAVCLIYVIVLAARLAGRAGVTSDMASMQISTLDLSSPELRQKLLYSFLSALLFGSCAVCIWLDRRLLALLPDVLAVLFGFLLLRLIFPKLRGYDPWDSRTY